MTVYDLAPGSSGTVAAVDAQGAIRRRLLDMGLHRHARVTVDRVAPLGDPIWIRLSGTHIALRKAEAASIRIEKDVTSEETDA